MLYHVHYYTKPSCGKYVRLKYTFGTSIKLGLAVEMSPKVFSEQFTNCERMSQAASADSVLLSTCKGQRQMINSLPK